MVTSERWKGKWDGESPQHQVSLSSDPTVIHRHRTTSSQSQEMHLIFSRWIFANLLQTFSVIWFSQPHIRFNPFQISQKFQKESWDWWKKSLSATQLPTYPKLFDQLHPCRCRTWAPVRRLHEDHGLRKLTLNVTREEYDNPIPRANFASNSYWSWAVIASLSATKRALTASSCVKQRKSGEGFDNRLSSQVRSL